MPVETQEIRSHTRGSKTSGKCQTEPKRFAPVATPVLAVAGQPAPQKGRDRPGSEHQQTHYKAWVKVNPQNHEERQSKQRPVIAGDVSPLEQEAEDGEKEPGQQMRAGKPVDGRRRHEQTGER